MRWAAGALASVAVAFMVGVLFVTGHWPSFTQNANGPVSYSTSALALVLESVQPDGGLDGERLKGRRVELARFFALLERTNPLSTPEQFTSADARLALWLNASLALRLKERSDEAGEWARYTSGVTIDGNRLTRFAIEYRYVEGFDDARLPFILAGEPLAPYEEAMLADQLTEGFRRWLSQPGVVGLNGKVLRVSPLLLTHQARLTASMPEGRQSLVQVLWAFSPQTCQTDTCVSQETLDRHCGLKLDQCRVE
jgi:hypothetical protein